MVTYYQGHTIRITHEVIEVWWPDHQRFAIADLKEVYVCRGDADPAAIRSIGVAAMAVVVFAGTWPALHSVPAVLIGVLVALIAVGYGSMAFRRYPTPLELHATYHGDEVRLQSIQDGLNGLVGFRRKLVRLTLGIGGNYQLAERLCGGRQRIQSFSRWRLGARERADAREQVVEGLTVPGPGRRQLFHGGAVARQQRNERREMVARLDDFSAVLVPR